ncbi:hypothetical protein KFL_001330170 [Klebsormidium nitens]|uniref:FAD-binding FR-type domain-containing protein n=1 Tax=Klebsormidium nitens TaxID=105231 RepID=A0A0U9HSW2_KLENI|nr:hypothetical protein KFL_001330170 [Klebsormidium nitens]|eukprot:GAQ83034.1 hypothetical protein KFL_001330170 [Klebsormidium nitens]
MAALARAANLSAANTVGSTISSQSQEDAVFLHNPLTYAGVQTKAPRFEQRLKVQGLKPATKFLGRSKQSAQRLRVSAVASVEAKPEAEEQKLEGVQKLWNAATVTSTQDISPGVRIVTLETEISREIVPLDASYMLPGQTAQIKLASGATEEAVPASAPFAKEKNEAVLLKMRGDITAGSTKVAMYTMSVKAPLELWVEEGKAPGLWNLKQGDEVEVGPFKQTGMDVRPILFLTRFPTVLVFARGTGLAAARALVEAQDTGSLNFLLRQEGRLYVSAPSPAELPFKNVWPAWESANVKVRPTVDATNGEPWDGFVGDLKHAFDEDDLEYEPTQTAVVVAGDAATIDEVLDLLQEAEIPEEQLIRWQCP